MPSSFRSVPVTNHPLREELSPNVQSELPLWQLPCPLGGNQREEYSTCPSAARLEEAVGCCLATPQPSLLQAEQSKRPHTLLVRFALQAFHHLSHSPLNTPALVTYNTRLLLLNSHSDNYFTECPTQAKPRVVV